MLRGAVALLALSACNQLLDLREAEPSATLEDTDGDGVVDSRDNCGAIANADQLDSDHDHQGDACDSCPTMPPTRDDDDDGIDDACDACRLGPPVDDDGDGLADACDLCPATPLLDPASPQHGDVDLDLIGDECDIEMLDRDHQRVHADAFTTIDPGWTNGASWQLAPGGTSVEPLASGATLAWTIGDDQYPVASALFDVAHDATVGIALAGPDLVCDVRCTEGACTLNADDNGEPRTSATFAAETVAVKAGAVRRFGLPGVEFQCRAYVGTKTFALDVSAQVAPGAQITLFASPGARVLGADVVN